MTPIQPDDLFRFAFLQDARLSPDGQYVAYSVSTYHEESDNDRIAIWLMSVETGERRQLTAGMEKDTKPCWSPDSRQMAFLSNRGEKTQIYIIQMDGGEAQVLTALEQGVGGAPQWSPDGQYIAFTAAALNPPDLNKPYRVTRAIYRFDYLGYVDGKAQDIYIIPAKGGEPTQLTHDDCSNNLPIWSPNGQELLFLSSMTPTLHRIRPMLKIVTLDGQVRTLVGEWGGVLVANWTVDGKRVVFVGNPMGLTIGTQDNLWVIDREGGEPECRTRELDYQVGGRLLADIPALSIRSPQLAVSADSRYAYVPVQAGGTGQIYQIALAGEEDCQAVLAGNRACLLQHAAQNQLLYFVSTMTNPLELFIAKMDGSEERQLTHLNTELLANRALPTAEHLLFPGSDGTQIEGWLLKPPTGEAPYPTILYIHGGPHLAYGHTYSFDFQMLAGAGYAVLFVNHRASTGYGDTFATQIKGDWGNLDYHDLMAGVDTAIELGWSDPDRLGCCGLSGGGNLSCWIVGHTDRFKAAVPENPVTNWVSFYGVSDIGPWFATNQMGGQPHEIPDTYRRCSPITYAHRSTTPTLLVQGEHDWRCPAEQSEQFYTVLKANGCTVEMLRLPNSPHGGAVYGPPNIRRAQNEALLGWMNRYVLGE